MAQEAFPLHYLVWNNQYLELDRELQKKEVRTGRGWLFLQMSHCDALMPKLYYYYYFNFIIMCVWTGSTTRDAWIRGDALRWSWLCVWATWSRPGCCSDIPRTRRTATRRAGPVSDGAASAPREGGSDGGALFVKCLDL